MLCATLYFAVHCYVLPCASTLLAMCYPVCCNVQCCNMFCSPPCYPVRNVNILCCALPCVKPLRYVRRPKISYQTQNTALSRWDRGGHTQNTARSTRRSVPDDQQFNSIYRIFFLSHSYFGVVAQTVCFASSNTMQCNLSSINEYYFHVQGCKNHFHCINTNKIWTVQKSFACSGMTSRTMSVLPLEI